jgi:hypothetical protein
MRRNRLQAFDALMVQGQRVPMRLPIWPTAGQPSAAEARSSETGHRRRYKTGSPDVLSARVSLRSSVMMSSPSEDEKSQRRREAAWNRL